MQRTQHFSSLATGILVACLTALVQACQGDTSEYNASIDGQPLRANFSRVQAYAPDDGPSLTRVDGRIPCTVGAVGDWLPDPARGAPLYGAEKIEMNFGDGTGWQDVTGDAARWDHNPFDGLDPARVTLHTYSHPGAYRISLRVTYYDGEIVTSTDPGGREPLVSVTE